MLNIKMHEICTTFPSLVTSLPVGKYMGDNEIKKCRVLSTCVVDVESMLFLIRMYGWLSCYSFT